MTTHTLTGPSDWIDLKAGDVIYSGAFCNFERAEPVRLVCVVKERRAHGGGLVARTWEVERA